MRRRDLTDRRSQQTSTTPASLFDKLDSGLASGARPSRSYYISFSFVLFGPFCGSILTLVHKGQ